MIPGDTSAWPLILLLAGLLFWNLRTAINDVAEQLKVISGQIRDLYERESEADRRDRMRQRNLAFIEAGADPPDDPGDF
jgi:hypothetical protein